MLYKIELQERVDYGVQDFQEYELYYDGDMSGAWEYARTELAQWFGDDTKVVLSHEDNQTIVKGISCDANGVALGSVEVIGISAVTTLSVMTTEGRKLYNYVAQKVEPEEPYDHVVAQALAYVSEYFTDRSIADRWKVITPHWSVHMFEYGWASKATVKAYLYRVVDGEVQFNTQQVLVDMRRMPNEL